MTGLNLSTVLLSCHKCKSDIKVMLTQIADEEVIFCSCGTEIRLMDFGHVTQQMLDEEETLLQDEVAESSLQFSTSVSLKTK